MSGFRTRFGLVDWRALDALEERRAVKPFRSRFGLFDWSAFDRAIGGRT